MMIVSKIRLSSLSASVVSSLCFTLLLYCSEVAVAQSGLKSFGRVEAVALQRVAFVFPIVRPKLSSRFGKRRHPIYKATRHHNGIDLAAPEGAAVRAIAPGRVVFSDPYKGYGKLVIIQHDFGLTSHYGHLDQINVTLGKRIKAGDILGTVGTTGKTTGPHLHLELRSLGQPLDPIELIPGLTQRAEG